MDRTTITAGLVGGLIGGVVFGAMLQSVDLVASVGRLVGQEGIGAGWLALLVVTGVLGVVYALTFGRLEHTWARGAAYGLAHGVVWWALGVLLIQPLLLGQALGAVSAATWINLVGYLLHGLAAGLAVTAMAHQRAVPAAAR